MIDPIDHHASAAEKRAQYQVVFEGLQALLEGIEDWVAAMATCACELHHAFTYYHWTGFYRRTGAELLTVGPYQGGHGCLTIDFARGVCGAAARSKQTQLVPDVHAFADHIACSSTTLSEIVVPVLGPGHELLAVFDVDSDLPAAFDAVDQECLESICDWLGARFGNSAGG